MSPKRGESLGPRDLKTRMSCQTQSPAVDKQKWCNANHKKEQAQAKKIRTNVFCYRKFTNSVVLMAVWIHLGWTLWKGILRAAHPPIFTSQVFRVQASAHWAKARAWGTAPIAYNIDEVTRSSTKWSSPRQLLAQKWPSPRLTSGKAVSPFAQELLIVHPCLLRSLTQKDGNILLRLSPTKVPVVFAVFQSVKNLLVPPNLVGGAFQYVCGIWVWVGMAHEMAQVLRFEANDQSQAAAPDGGHWVWCYFFKPLRSVWKENQ